MLELLSRKEIVLFSWVQVSVHLLAYHCGTIYLLPFILYFSRFALLLLRLYFLIMKYLDPKADLTFKKVFGEHPGLVISFFNSFFHFGGNIKEYRYQ